MSEPVCAMIGIGANLGDPAAQVRAAMQALDQLDISGCAVRSSLYDSAPLDAGGDNYVNAVVRIMTPLAALDLLRQLQRIEHEAGRLRPYPNAPRSLDLDLLLYGDEHITHADLIVPHPRMTQRAFVLHPLLEIAPEVMIPGVGPAHQFIPALVQQHIRQIID
jgi:2-amino-4-hydroxy-6-hydroxymethyldihydropteridine diphosphokinase